MGFAKWTFRIAGIYGFVVLAPMYLMEQQVGQDFPPAITHPEYYYGFIGVALSFQILFLILSTDPLKFRMMMIPSILEKATYGIAVLGLFLQGRINPVIFYFSLVDLTFGLLFLIAYLKTDPTAQEDATPTSE